MKERICIDGSQGEGGGQILRTSLALSLVTGKPFRIEKIRALRKKPGLMRQHLTSVRAAAEVGGARVSGDAFHSTELDFAPGAVRAGAYRFAVGTAGSSNLVLQTVLPALLVADGPSELLLEGGTHNPFAPPFDFLAKAFAPLLARMGPRVTMTLDRYGFYPAGGGRCRVHIEPAPLGRLELTERGEILGRKARAIVARLPRRIADEECKVVLDMLAFDRAYLSTEGASNSVGPGNILVVELASENVTEVFCGFGMKGVPAETVARRAVDEVREYLAAKVPVGKYLADQLLIPMAMGRGGRFRTLPPTRHTLTNMEVVKRFLEVEIEAQKLGGKVWELEVRKNGEEGTS